MIWKHRSCSDQRCQLRGRAAEMGEGCVQSCRVEMCLQERFMILNKAEDSEEQRFGMINEKQVLLFTATTEPLIRSVRRSQF